MERLGDGCEGVHPAFTVARVAGRRGAADARDDVLCEAAGFTNVFVETVGVGQIGDGWSQRWWIFSCC